MDGSAIFGDPAPPVESDEATPVTLAVDDGVSSSENGKAESVEVVEEVEASSEAKAAPPITTASASPPESAPAEKKAPAATKPEPAAAAKPAESKPEPAASASKPEPAASASPATDPAFTPPVERPAYNPDANLSGQLVAHAEEVVNIFEEIERLKAAAGARDDWEALMIFIAVQKARVSQMSSDSKSIYDKVYGDRFEELLSSGEKLTMERVRVLATRDCYREQALAKRLEQAWSDMQSLLWVIKSVTENITGEHRGPNMAELPDVLFNHPDEIL